MVNTTAKALRVRCMQRPAQIPRNSHRYEPVGNSFRLPNQLQVSSCHKPLGLRVLEAEKQNQGLEPGGEEDFNIIQEPTFPKATFISHPLTVLELETWLDDMAQGFLPPPSLAIQEHRTDQPRDVFKLRFMKRDYAR